MSQSHSITRWSPGRNNTGVLLTGLPPMACSDFLYGIQPPAHGQHYYSRLRPPTSSLTKKMLPQTCPKANLMGTSLEMKFQLTTISLAPECRQWALRNGELWPLLFENRACRAVGIQQQRAVTVTLRIKHICAHSFLSALTTSCTAFISMTSLLWVTLPQRIKSQRTWSFLLRYSEAYFTWTLNY